MRTPLAIAGLVVLLSGCMASYPVNPNETLAPAARVTITFAEPRDLEARRDTAAYLPRSSLKSSNTLPRLLTLRTPSGPRVQEQRRGATQLIYDDLHNIARPHQPRLCITYLALSL